MEVNRRSFGKMLLGASLVGGCKTAPRIFSAPTRRISELRVAVIGIGARGETVLREVLRTGAKVVALCDPDSSALRLGGDGVEVFQRATPALYRDWRILFSRVKNLDAVFICTPDHHHFEIAMAAVEKGVSVHIEPPAVRTVAEWRLLTKAAIRANTALAVGRGDISPATLAFAENCLRGGILGKVHSIVAWTNQPLWPQGVKQPEGCDALPRHLDWELWTGAKKLRPWRDGYYLHGAWRAWRDFGSGAWGAAAPQLLGTAFTALKLGTPSTIEIVQADRGAGGSEKFSYPVSETLRFTVDRDGTGSWFGRGDSVEVFWHDGVGNPAKVVEGSYGIKLPPSGCMIVGSAGTWLAGGPQADLLYFAVNGEPALVPAERHVACQTFLPGKDSKLMPGQFKCFLEKIANGDRSVCGKYELLFNETIAKGIML